MRGRRALVVLVALAAAVGGLAWWDRGRPSTDDARAARARLMPGFDRARAFTITLARGGETIRLERERDAWWLTTPRRRADDGAVEAILGELEFGQVERRLYPDASARERMGLTAPRVTLTVGDFVVRVGGDAPGGRTVYAQRGGEDEALVVEHRLADVTDRARFDFLSKRLTVDSPNAAHRLRVGNLEFERGDRGWRLTSPFKLPADPARIEAWLAALDGARALREFDVAPVVGSAASVFLDGKMQAMTGGECPHHPSERAVARDDNAHLCFEAAKLDALQPDARTFVDHRLLAAVDVDGVRRFVLQGPGARDDLILARKDGAWRIEEPARAAGPADDEAVREWLAALAAVRVGEQHSFSQQQVAALTLQTPDGDVRLSLERDGREWVILRDGDSERVGIDAATRALFDVDAARFRPRRILQFSAGDARRVRVEEGGAVEEAARAGGGGWRLTRPEAIGGDDEVIARLLDALAGLRADRFAAGAPLRVARKIVVGLGTGEASLELGAAGADGCFGRVARAPIFHLPPETCAALGAHLASRRPFDVRADRLRAIAVERGGDRFLAERAAGGWTVGGKPLSAARLDALVEALRSLTASSVDGYGNLPQPARTTIRLSTEGAPDQQLDAAAPSGGVARARLHGGRALYRVAAADLDALVTLALR